MTQPKQKKIPMRMCVGCREMKEKRELVRVVRKPEGGVAVDATGKMSGRGAYLCRSTACLERARKIRAIERALDVRLDDELFAQLEKEIIAVDERQH